MSVVKSFNNSNSDTQTTILAWVFGVGILVAVIIGLLLSNAGVFNRDLTIAEEKVKCQETADGTVLRNGTDGYCEVYKGSDGDLHYKYVQVTDATQKETKDVYIIWETGKSGCY